MEALLDRRDHVAALGLLMQWLSQADEVGLQASTLSFDRLLLRWLDLVAELTKDSPADAWPMLRRLFAYLEANAGDFWNVPQLDESLSAADWVPTPDEEEEDHGLFGAAYEGVTFRDSADDGQFGDTYDEPSAIPDAGEFEFFERRLEPRLHFLRLLAQLWQTTAGLCARGGAADGDRPDYLRSWLERVERVQQELLKLLDDLSKREITAPPGDHDSNVEYDAQLQTKLYLVQTTINTVVSFRSAQWFLQAALPAGAAR